MTKLLNSCMNFKVWPSSIDFIRKSPLSDLIYVLRVVGELDIYQISRNLFGYGSHILNAVNGFSVIQSSDLILLN